MKPKEYISKSREETQKIASDFAKKLKGLPAQAGGEVLCFYGNLGSGKTTFIQSLAKALGVKENVTSPTFVLMKSYDLKKEPRKLYHMDAYRLGSSQEALDLGLEEILENPDNITAIEWADKIADVLPKKRIDLCFDHVKNDERKITIFK